MTDPMNPNELEQIVRAISNDDNAKFFVQLMHFRSKEGDYMQKFANDHSDHELATAVLNDYVEEPPEDFTDVFEKYHGKDK
jgi:hypothetical protein